MKKHLKKKTANTQKKFPFEMKNLDAEIKNCQKIKKFIKRFLVKAVQDLAEKHKQTPTYGQFTKEVKISKNIIYGLIFKDYNELLRTAGLKINRKSSRKPREA